MSNDKVEGASCSQPKVGGASSSPSPQTRELEAPATLPAPATWEYFNPHTEIRILSGGDLPHWQQETVWYFITYRLADALPKQVVDELTHQRELWEKTHTLDNLSKEELIEYYKLFSERHENLLNAGVGSCLLRDPENAKIVTDAFHFFEHQRYELDEFVVMPNHVHILLKPLRGFKLEDILHSWKSFTAKEINKRTGRTGQLWQHESYDHIVRNERAMNAIRTYIRENPKVGGASSSPINKVAGASCSLSQKVGGASSSPSKTREQDAPATIEQ